jgi:glutamate-1-semialdehyde aminotransferase
MKPNNVNLKKSQEFLKRAESLIPALSQTFSKAHYSYVSGTYPTYLKHGKGSHVFDVDDNEYIDYVLGLGPVILGYCYKSVDDAIKKQIENGISFSMPHYLEVEFSEKLQKIIPGSEMVRFAKTGSDAVTACVKAARAYTGKDHILYTGHGGVWHDWFTAITSKNEGIPKFNQELIHLFRYNDLQDAKNTFKRFEGKVAAIVMEPIWLDYPNENYLQELKELAHKNNALLIFDEVLTGFRLANGGAQELFRIEADMVAFGKAIGNGAPLAAITGKEEYMKKFNDVFYSTTYGGETLSIAAGMAVVNEFLTKDIISHCWGIGQLLKDGIEKIGKEIGIDIKWNGTPVRGDITFAEINGISANLQKSIFLQECIKNNVMFGPGETLICYSHSQKDIEKTLEVCKNALEKMKPHLQTGSIHNMLEGKEIKKVMTF